jgi:integrase
MALTHKQIEHLQGDPTRRFELPVGAPVGLYLIVHPTGVKTFALRYRYHGKPVKLTLGNFPDMPLAIARSEAEAALADLRNDVDPAAKKKIEEQKAIQEQKAAEPTARDAEAVAEEWLKRDVARTKTAADVERLLRKEVLPGVKGMLITEVSKADVVRIINAIMDRGKPITANRTLSIIKRWFNWCIGSGYPLTISPAAGVPAPGEERSRERILTDDEVRDVWHASGAIGYPWDSYFRVLLLTAQRRGEVAGMRWVDVDLEKAIWTLPKEQTKANRTHDVPLTKKVLAILKALPRFNKGPYVFTTTNGVKAINGFAKMKKKLDAEVFKLTGIKPEPGEGYTVHDFRRTAATNIAKMGVPPHVLSALLNHTPGAEQGVTAIYNRFRYTEERRAALELWAARVTKLAAAKRRKIA